MNLNDALALIATELNLDTDRLIQYAAEDDLPFRPTDESQVSIYSYPFENDGRLLYALVRELKPLRVLEVGCNHGGSAAHIALALRTNVSGLLWTVDISKSATISNVPIDLQNRVRLYNEMDAGLWMHPDHGIDTDVIIHAPFDFIHEDSSHEPHVVHSVYHCLPQLIPKGGVILSHDVCTGVGDDVLGGIHAAGYPKPLVVCLDNSPGFSVMKYQGVEVRA